MAEETKPTPPPEVKPTEAKPSTEPKGQKEALAKLTSLDTQLKSFEGKPGYNPFKFRKQNNLAELKERVLKGDLSAIAEVNKLPTTVNPVALRLDGKPLSTETKKVKL